MHRQQAVVLQRCVRTHIASQQYRRLIRTALTAQCRWRTVLAKRDATARRTVKRAASRIQAYARRRPVRRAYLLSRTAIMRLQRGWRCVLAKRQLRKRRCERRQWECATGIQSQVRRRAARRTAARRRAAIVVMQCARRCMLAHRKLRGRREHRARKLAAVTIQVHVRRRAGQREPILRRAAIVVMQCTRRCVIARRKLRGRREHRARELAAVMIQSYVRRRAGQRELARRLEIRAVRRIQRHCRQRAARRTATRRRAAVQIQACARGYIQPSWRSLAKEPDEQEPNAGSCSLPLHPGNGPGSHRRVLP